MTKAANSGWGNIAWGNRTRKFRLGQPKHCADNGLGMVSTKTCAAGESNPDLIRGRDES